VRRNELAILTSDKMILTPPTHHNEEKQGESGKESAARCAACVWNDAQDVRYFRGMSRMSDDNMNRERRNASYNNFVFKQKHIPTSHTSQNLNENEDFSSAFLP